VLVRLLRQLLPTEYNTLQYLSPCELLNGLSGAGALSTLLPSNCLLPYAAKHRTTKLPINHHRSSGWLASGAVAKLLRSALLGLHLSFRTPRPDLPTIAFVVKTNNATETRHCRSRLAYADCFQRIGRDPFLWGCRQPYP